MDASANAISKNKAFLIPRTKNRQLATDNCFQN
jgi:hypothetical protein